MLIIIILAIRSYFLGRNNLSFKLFSEALRNENSGQFEEALIVYENALKVAGKTRHSGSKFRQAIIDKIKVLNTAIDYRNNLQFSR